MKRNVNGRPLALIIGLILLAAILSACGDYQTPITDEATRKIDPALIGDWVSSNKRVRIKVRGLNETAYVVTYNEILFKAFHSDFAGVSFVSVQELETPERSFTFLAYRMSDDGTKLYLRLVNKEVIPENARTLQTVQSLLKANLQEPELFLREEVFTKEKWSTWSISD